MNIRFNNGIVPVSSEKHLARWTRGKRGFKRTIMAVIPDGREECRCILVEGEDHTYITDDFMVTHNSIFGMQLARFLAGRGDVVLFVSRELSVVRLVRRNWAAYGANMMNLRTGKPGALDLKSIGDYARDSANWELFYDDRSRTVADIAKEAEALRPDIIIIDYLQRLAYDTEKEYAAITRIVNELQDLTLESDIPVVCLSQLSRPQKGFEWKPPGISDTRGSGAVEERAANIILLHRMWETKEEDAYGKKVKVGTMQSEDGYFIVGKCADGECGLPIPVTFHGAHMRVQERMT